MEVVVCGGEGEARFHSHAGTCLLTLTNSIARVSQEDDGDLFPPYPPSPDL